MTQRRVTSYDVAQLAGVSQPTVSRAFTPDANISPKTRARVLAAARKLGYQPNAIARGLTTHRTDIIGVVMGNIANSMFYPAVLDMLASRLQALDKQILFFNTNVTRPVDEILPRIMSYRVDALIIASTTPGRELVDMCTGMGMPVVLMNRMLTDTTANAVCSDNESGGYQVGDLLLRAGHKRLAFVSGIGITATNTLRERGFRAALRAHGMTDLRIDGGAYTYESGYEAAVRLLTRDDPPDAIFCAADILALGALDAARYELGLRVPEQVSIIGYDDIPMAGWHSYNLTTIRQSVVDMVEAVLQLFIDREEDQPIATGQLILLPDELVRRGSARLPAVE